MNPVEQKQVHDFINYMIRNVSPHLKSDCYQAAYIGVLKLYQKYDPSRSKFTTYIKANKGYIEHEILKEVAKLSFPFTIGKSTLIELMKYKRGELFGASEKRRKSLERLATIKREPYDITIEDSRSHDD